jgi:hypothetical protein
MIAIRIEMGSAVVRRAGRNGERIVVAKADAGFAPSLVWLVHPACERLTLRFGDVYGVYCGSAPGRPGERIEPLAVIYPARDLAYAALAVGFRHADALRPPLGHYGIRNDAEVPLAAGLVQAVRVAGARVLAPINVAFLAPRRAAEFVPVRDVLVWLADDVAPGFVLSEIPERALRLAYDTRRADWLCTYDPDTERFTIPGS